MVGFCYFSFYFRQSRCLSFLLVPEPTLLTQALSLQPMEDALPACFAVMLLGFRNVRRSGRVTGVRKGPAPLQGTRWAGRGTGTGQQQCPMLSLSCCSHFFCLPSWEDGFSAPNTPLHIPFSGQISGPRGCLPLVPFTRGLEEGTGSLPAAPAVLVGLCNPSMFEKA